MGYPQNIWNLQLTNLHISWARALTYFRVFLHLLRFQSYIIIVSGNLPRCSTDFSDLRVLFQARRETRGGRNENAKARNIFENSCYFNKCFVVINREKFSDGIFITEVFLRSFSDISKPFIFSAPCRDHLYDRKWKTFKEGCVNREHTGFIILNIICGLRMENVSRVKARSPERRKVYGISTSGKSCTIAWASGWGVRVCGLSFSR